MYIEEPELVEVIDYKDCKISIYQDLVARAPSKDCFGKDEPFLVNYHSDCWITDKRITKEDAEAVYNGKKIALHKQYHILPLACLIHSGAVLSLSYSFDCDPGGWDTSHVGLVLIPKKEARTKAKARKIAENLIQRWNDYLSGNMVGYMAETKDGEDCGSCWGFYGSLDKQDLIDRAKSDIDYFLKQKQEKNTKKLKTLIKNSVPLDKRVLN